MTTCTCRREQSPYPWPCPCLCPCLCPLPLPLAQRPHPSCITVYYCVQVSPTPRTGQGLGADAADGISVLRPSRPGTMAGTKLKDGWKTPASPIPFIILPCGPTVMDARATPRHPCGHTLSEPNAHVTEAKVNYKYHYPKLVQHLPYPEPTYGVPTSSVCTSNIVFMRGSRRVATLAQPKTGGPSNLPAQAPARAGAGTQHACMNPGAIFSLCVRYVLQYLHTYLSV